MALFYWLDWRRAPDASSMIAAPDLDVRDKASIARSWRFAAAQAESSDEAKRHNTRQILDTLASKRTEPAEPSSSDSPSPQP